MLIPDSSAVLGGAVDNTAKISVNTQNYGQVFGKRRDCFLPEDSRFADQEAMIPPYRCYLKSMERLEEVNETF